MQHISEEGVRKFVDHATAFDAVRDVFSAMGRGAARNFHVVREAIGHADAAEPGAAADVIITIPSSHVAQLMAGMARPGTHIACRGTDTKGKQELDPQIFAAARVFADDIAQSVSIGEVQHAVAQGLIAEAKITQIGAVANGDHPGRSSADDITIFDGTGIGLQDLAVAHLVLATSQGQPLPRASRTL